MNIYLLDIFPLLKHNMFKKYYDNCPQYRKDKINRISQNFARCRSLGAEILLNYGMKNHEISSYNIVTSPQGKPFAENCKIHFNLSHSGRYAAAAFSDTDIGIDIETPRKIDLRLAERLFSPEERKSVNNSDNAEREFLRIWTRKEALLKASGCGITHNISDTDVLENSVTFEGRKYMIKTIIEKDYILSVSSPCKITKPTIEHIILK